MEARELRGQEMAKAVKIVPKEGQWVVPSSTGSGKYLVRLGEESTRCTCPDFEVRGKKCKHIFAVEYTIRAEVSTDGEATEATLTETQTVTETTQTSTGEEETVTKTRRRTYKQKWPAYNAAQTHEKRDFLGLLRDLCQGIEEPPQGMGRPRLPLSDMVFAATFKIYSTVSGRRFMSDLTDAHEKGYLSSLPHYNSIFNYLEREDLTPLLRSLVERSALPLTALETDFAVDSTAFTTSRFERWFNVKYGHEQNNHVWFKAHLMCGVTTNVVTAVEVTGSDVHDSTQMVGLVDTTAENFTLADVTADKAYGSQKNASAVAKHGGTPYIPFKSFMTGQGRGKDTAAWQKMYHLYAYHRDEFLGHYHQRSNMESTVHMIKSKFGDAVRSKTDTAIENEILCKVLCHNLCCLIQSFYEFKIDVGLAGSVRPSAPQALALVA